MPWELGKCSFAASQRHVNARNVVWIATANTGHQLVFDHQTQRTDPNTPMDRKEYIELINLLRPDVTACLGVSASAGSILVSMIDVVKNPRLR